jgi:hypothetical protein
MRLLGFALGLVGYGWKLMQLGFGLIEVKRPTGASALRGFDDASVAELGGRRGRNDDVHNTAIY